MPDPFVIDTADLRKSYPGADALRGLTLQIPAGSICGFLGLNGAGKTTTIKILLGMTRPTAGRARVFGLDVADRSAGVDIRRRTGFVGENKDLYEQMTPVDLIRFTSDFFPRWRADLADRYARQFELPDRRVKELSRGTRTKLALLLALCRGAELLVLDEPTAGLDPAMAEQVLQAIVHHVASEGATVFFSSHQIVEVEQIADRVAIIDAGRLVVGGLLDEVRDRFRRIRLVFDGDAPAPPSGLPGLVRMQRAGRVLTMLADGGADRIVDAMRVLEPTAVDVAAVSLKEIFLETVVAEG
jgi:ABC-2 type transport system ATP-binding protein